MSVIISKNLFQLMSPVMYVSRLFCLLPLAWKENNNNYIIKKSASYTIYSNAVTFFLISATIFGVCNLYNCELVRQTKYATVTKQCVVFTDMIATLTPALYGVVLTSVRINKYLDYFNHLKQFDTLIKAHPPKSYRCLFVTVATLVYTTVLVGSDFINGLQSLHECGSLETLLFYVTPHFMCYYFSMIMELFYWFLVHSIRIRVFLLNEVLLKLNVAESFENKNILSIKTTKRHQAPRTFPFRDLLKAYQELEKAANLVNECYGLIILMLLFGCFIALLVTPFNIYGALLKGVTGVNLIMGLLWMFGHIFRLLLIVEPCHDCLNEANNTSKIVSDLSCFDLSTDPETQKFLKYFNTYSVQCKIEFTAFGLTQLDRSILGTITGAVCTYLVVLLQFK